MNNNLYQILFDEFKNVETNICIDVPGQRKWSYKDIDVLLIMLRNQLLV